MDVQSSKGVGPWGSLETLNQEEKEFVGNFTEEQRKILPKVNKLDPRGRIWMGSYPGASTVEEAIDKMDVLINDLGIKTFLCLQEGHELEELKHYMPVAEAVADVFEKQRPNFINFPIKDVDVADDEKLLDFLDKELLPQIKNGDILPLYVHCRGGNGRTGTVSALLLSHLYGLDGKTALKKVGEYHSTRLTPIFSAPETKEQEKQVLRLSSSMSGIELEEDDEDFESVGEFDTTVFSAPDTDEQEDQVQRLLSSLREFELREDEENHESADEFNFTSQELTWIENKLSALETPSRFHK